MCVCVFACLNVLHVVTKAAGNGQFTAKEHAVSSPVQSQDDDGREEVELSVTAHIPRPLQTLPAAQTDRQTEEQIPDMAISSN